MKKICNGKINNNGHCMNCGQVSQITSGYCINLIESGYIDLRQNLLSFAQQFYSDEETCKHNVDKYLKQKGQWYVF